MRSNLSVGMPIDLICYERDSLEVQWRRRFDDGDPYFTALATNGTKIRGRCFTNCLSCGGGDGSSRWIPSSSPVNTAATGYPRPIGGCFGDEGAAGFPPRVRSRFAGHGEGTRKCKAVDCTIEAVEGDGRAGVVWHTQGSGKRLEMLFACHHLIEPAVPLRRHHSGCHGRHYAAAFSANCRSSRRA
jgi:hypothetical protein